MNLTNQNGTMFKENSSLYEETNLDSNQQTELASLSCFVLVTLIANVFVFGLMFRVKGERLFSNMLIHSLVASDVMIGAIAMSVELARSFKFPVVVDNPTISLLGHWSAYSQSSVSLYTISILSVQRLSLVVRPFKTSEKMNWRKWLAISLAWALPYLAYGVFILVLITQNLSTQILENYSANEISQNSKQALVFLIIKYSINIVAYLLPCILILILNIAIIVCLVIKAKRKRAYTSGSFIKHPSPSNNHARASSKGAQAREKKAILRLKDGEKIDLV